MKISIGGKCSDMFMASGQGLDYDGYVPSNLSIGGGDYLRIEVDVETGKIVGWNPDDWKEFISRQRAERINAEDE